MHCAGGQEDPCQRSHGHGWLLAVPSGNEQKCEGKAKTCTGENLHWRKPALSCRPGENLHLPCTPQFHVFSLSPAAHATHAEPPYTSSHTTVEDVRPNSVVHADRPVAKVASSNCRKDTECRPATLLATQQRLPASYLGIMWALHDRYVMGRGGGSRERAHVCC